MNNKIRWIDNEDEKEFLIRQEIAEKRARQMLENNRFWPSFRQFGIIRFILLTVFLAVFVLSAGALWSTVMHPRQPQETVGVGAYFILFGIYVLLFLILARILRRFGIV